MSILTISKLNRHYGIKSNPKSFPSAENPWSFIVEVTNKQDLLNFMEVPDYKYVMKLMCQLLGWNPFFNVSFPIGEKKDQFFRFKYTITSSVDLPTSGVANNILKISKFYSNDDQNDEIKKVIFDEVKAKVTSKILHISRIKNKVDHLKEMNVNATYKYVEFIQYFSNRKSFDLLHRHNIKVMSAVNTHRVIKESYFDKIRIVLKLCFEDFKRKKKERQHQERLSRNKVAHGVERMILRKLKYIREKKIVVENGVISHYGEQITSVHIGKIKKAIKNGEIWSGTFFVYANHNGVIVSNGKLILDLTNSRKYKKNERLRSKTKRVESGMWILHTKHPNKSNLEHERTNITEDELKCLKIASSFTCRFPRAKRPISINKPSKLLRSIINQSKLLVSLLMNGSNIAETIINCCWRTFDVISFARDILYSMN